jgi:hypothetical protein
MLTFEQLMAITSQHVAALRATRPPETLDADSMRWAFLVTLEEMDAIVTDLKTHHPDAVGTAEQEGKMRAGLVPLVLPNYVVVLPELDLLLRAAESAGRVQ